LARRDGFGGVEGRVSAKGGVLRLWTKRALQTMISVAGHVQDLPA
jgi:hypothetical protein